MNYTKPGDCITEKFSAEDKFSDISEKEGTWTEKKLNLLKFHPKKTNINFFIKSYFFKHKKKENYEPISPPEKSNFSNWVNGISVGVVVITIAQTIKCNMKK